MKRNNNVLDKGKESESDGGISAKRPSDAHSEASTLDPQAAKHTSDSIGEEQLAARVFHQFIKDILPSTENVLDNDNEVSKEVHVQEKHLHKLLWKSAKLKSLKAMKYVPTKILIRLLTALECSISDGMQQCLLAETEYTKKSEEERKLCMDRILRAVNASISTLHILTSYGLPVSVYMEDVIDKIIILSQLLLEQIVYPFYDPIYKTSCKPCICFVLHENGRCNNKKTKETFMSLYNKLVEIVNLLSELLTIQHLTDNVILHITSIAIKPFYVENVNELQLAALKLAAEIFTRYEKHRRLILNEILDSTAQVSRNKGKMRSFHLNSSHYIQIQTALILQIVQSSVLLPEEMQTSEKLNANICHGKKTDPISNKTLLRDNDCIISTRYDSALSAAGYFLRGFLNKCAVKKEETCYKTLFENFIRDVLIMLNKPEWPVAELFVNLLGHLLASNIQNKSTDVALRIISLDFLGPIATKLKREAMNSHMHSETLIQYLKERRETLNDLGEKRCKKAKLERKENLFFQKCDNKILQGLLLEYLQAKERNDHILMSARHFYIVQWYRDALTKQNMLSEGTKKGSVHKMISSTQSKEIKSKNSKHNSKEGGKGESYKASEKENNRELSTFIQSQKEFLITKIKRYQESMQAQTELGSCIDSDTAELITQYLATKRPLYENFYIYLRQILCALTENISIIRARAMKCLTSIIEVDPSLLERTDVHRGVCYSFFDNSVSVREAAVDLVGKYVLNQYDLLDQYYDILSSRILDTGINVRKRVLKIFKDICIKYPDFPKIPEICAKIVRRINDQESIVKLVIRVFRDMWFTPMQATGSNSSSELVHKVTNIVKVIASLQKTEMIFFEKLLKSLFTLKDSAVTEESSKPLLVSCKEIVNCLVQSVLKTDASFGSESEELHSSHQLVACFTTLYLFAKSFPVLFVNHVSTLQPYLSIRSDCITQGDMLIVKYVAQIFQLVMPLVQHPSPIFLSQLEENLLKLILLYDPTVIENCLSCLSTVINNMTRNFKLIRDIFERYNKHLKKYKYLYEKNPCNSLLKMQHPYVRRCLFTIGLLFRYFDFNNKDVSQGLSDTIVDEVFVLLMHFLKNTTEDLQIYSLNAIGSLCISHNEYIIREEYGIIINSFLASNNTSLSMRIQVLKNLYAYLKEEETSLVKLEKETIKSQKHENLKEMGNRSCDTASKMVQLHCEAVMQSCLHSNITVRQAALKLVQLVIHQGLIQPFQIIPYLIGMATDEDMMIRQVSETLLEDIEKQHPGIIHMKSQQGIDLSYKLQMKLQSINNNSEWIRGFRIKENENPVALNGILYAILRTSVKSRRALITNLLKRFENQSPDNLPLLLYIADNLAYFSYVLFDEPLFVIHLIDTMILVCGTYVTDKFSEISLPTDDSNNIESEDNFATYISLPKTNRNQRFLLKIPEDTVALQRCVSAAQSCIFLVDLKQYLKTLYSVSDEKIMQYSPAKSTRVSEKSVKHCSAVFFTPRIIVQNMHIGTNILTDTEKKALTELYILFKDVFDPDEG